MSGIVFIEIPSPGIAVLRLNAPERKNALTGDMAREINSLMDRLANDPTIAVIIVAGSAGSFCAGAHRDLLDNVAAGDPVAELDIADVYRIFEKIREAPQVVVAAVVGPAVGAGLNIALAADLRIVAEDAYLRSMFVANGIHPGGAHLKMLLEAAGNEQLTAMALLDLPVRGSQFASRGLAHEAVPAPEVEARAIEVARFAAAQPELVRLIKSSANQAADQTYAHAQLHEGEIQRKTLKQRVAPA